MRERICVAKWIRILLALIIISVVAGCTGMKQSLYNMAVEREREKAGLLFRQIQFEGKPIVLLESAQAKDKPTLVLLHGFGANKDNWVRFAGFLTDTFHVVALDLPGHGDSFKDMNMRYDLDDQVRYLNTILRQLDIQSFHLAGNSMGGAISCLYAATYPQQIRSLILLAPGGMYPYESELNKQLKEGKNPLIVENTDDFDRLMDFALEKKPFIPWPITSVMAEKALANRTINQKIFADIRGDHAYEFETALKKITSPTLIIWGKQDRVLNVENASVFQQMIPGAEKTIIEGIGHVPMVEDPEATATICRNFITAKESGPR